MIYHFKKNVLFLIFLLYPSQLVFAATPTLNTSPLGDGNTVSVNITNADGNSPVVLFYPSALYSAIQSQNIGTTDSNGTFSGTVSTSMYGITTKSLVYALINGYQTRSVTWPYTTALPSSANTVTFSKINPGLLQGQTLVITVSGGTGSYYISSNSNQNAVQASVSGNLLSLSGSQAGTATILVCSSNAVCSNQVVTVTHNTNPGSLYLTQSNVSIEVGKAVQVIVTGGTAPYSTYYDGTNKVTANVVGTVITITGVSQGATSVTICGVSGGCVPLQATVTPSSISTTAITISVPLAIGQTLSLPLSGGSMNYYIATPITSPFNATISGKTLYVVGTAVGNRTVTICASTTSCSTIAFAVSGEVATKKITSVTPSFTKYIFTVPLYKGMMSTEVKKLQERMVYEGYFSVTPNGYFGQATQDAVKAYQRDRGLVPFGNVGPATREELNR